MSGESFDQDAWLDRIGYRGPREATLAVLRDLVYAHATAISYESIDVLLDRPPTLDLETLQRKMISQRRGGYCFEHNFLFRLACVRSPSMSPACRRAWCADLRSMRRVRCCTWCFRSI
jgi:N-hydroxyarylamine O-acetyltransferase